MFIQPLMRGAGTEKSLLVAKRKVYISPFAFFFILSFFLSLCNVHLFRK